MRHPLASGPVNGRRGAGSTRGPRTRRLVRPLLGVALALAAVVIPVDSGDLPVELERIAGTSPANAQSPWSVVTGNGGNPCPETPVAWKASFTGSECQLDTEPCPATPVPGLGTSVLRYSVGYPDADGLTLREYPGFCELRILESNGADAFATCQGMTGVAVIESDVELIVDGEPESVGLCRLVQPAACTAGVRVDFDICRAVQRRTWTCPPNHRPMNEFNACYQPPEEFTGTSHPACGAGAPNFVIQSCEDYVGSDFSPYPDLIDCSTEYVTANTPGSDTTLSNIEPEVGSSNYWCEFNPVNLDIVCRGSSPPATECAPAVALCLKRASQTGGCSAIANAIRCRGLQADYRADRLTAPEVVQEGCQPCVILPFSSVPVDCPDNLSAEVEISKITSHFNILRVQEDYQATNASCQPDSDGNIPASCLSASKCTDPARGRVTWSSTHASQVAVVNAPVIMSMTDIPVELREVNFEFNLETGTLESRRLVFPYPVSPAGEFGYSMARFGVLDPARGRIDSVSKMVGNVGECVFGHSTGLTSWSVPQFRMTIRELWPDSPSDLEAIEFHFGPEALDWWSDLAALGPDEEPDREQRVRTVERGLGYWPLLTTAEREERVARLTQEVDCNHALPVWCRWVPSRAGYFEVTGSGAWFSTRWSRGGRTTLSTGDVQDINDYLSNPANRLAVEAQLATWEATPEDVGLADDLSGVRPLEDRNHRDTRYSESETRFSCGGTDIRVYCATGGGETIGHYTETDPIGVAVHEVRVVTRTPNS